MDIAPGGGVVGADWEQGDVDFPLSADLLESLEPCAVAAVIDGAAGVLDQEPAEPPMLVMEHPGAPVLGRCERDLERSDLHALPSAEFVNAVESKALHKITDMLRDHDRLIRGDRAQRPLVEVVEMGMAHQHEVDRRKFVNLKPRLLQSLDHLEPFGPVGIDQHRMLRRLDQEGGVTDPGDSDLVARQFGESGTGEHLLAG